MSARTIISSDRGSGIVPPWKLGLDGDRLSRHPSAARNYFSGRQGGPIVRRRMLFEVPSIGLRLAELRPGSCWPASRRLGLDGLAGTSGEARP